MLADSALSFIYSSRRDKGKAKMREVPSVSVPSKEQKYSRLHPMYQRLLHDSDRRPAPEDQPSEAQNHAHACIGLCSSSSSESRFRSDHLDQKTLRALELQPPAGGGHWYYCSGGHHLYATAQCGQRARNSICSRCHRKFYGMPDYEPTPCWCCLM